MGARIGDLYASSGVSGVDPSGLDRLEPVEGAAGQAHFGLRNVITLAEQGGLSAEDIGHITVLVQDYVDLAAVDRAQRAGGRTPAVALGGVDGSDPTANALAFVHTQGVTFPVGADRDYAVTQGRFAFAGLPEAVMVRGDGTIAHITYGPLSAADLRTWERRLTTPSGT